MGLRRMWVHLGSDRRRLAQGCAEHEEMATLQYPPQLLPAPSEEADLCGRSPVMGHLYKDKTALGGTTVETKAGSAG